MVNLDVKSNLAKLLATENIIIQHNNVKTASFDVKDRVLTLPIFKEQSGDVYDMLIAHECAHALFTPYEEWKGIDDDELRSYVNVLEDTRIDLLIQKKYPGVVKNYMNGFDILDKKNFFSLLGRDINKDLMIIDKINLRSKSLKRLPFNFSSLDKTWLVKVDAIKTFKDVVNLAKEMLDWQKKQVEDLKKLPDFSDHPISIAYDLDDDDDSDDEDSDNQLKGSGEGDNTPDVEKSDDDSDDEKNDFNNFGDQKADSEKDSNKDSESKDGDGDKKEEDKKDDKGEAQQYGKGADGFEKGPVQKRLRAITDDSYQENTKKLADSESKGYKYGKLPKANLDKGTALISYKQFIKDFRNHIAIDSKSGAGNTEFRVYLKNKFKQFTKDNRKTVMYLVKEFEMKKSATAYKRASTDKTGVIDPLKLPQYKYSDDIFKRLTVLPDGKNHGMMMLLDWSGSMADSLFNTVKQLINLIEFCKKINIPFEVYFFNSERARSFYDKTYEKSFKYNTGDWKFEDFQLVNCASHRMKKTELAEALMYMYQMGSYYDYRYTRNRFSGYDSDQYRAESQNYGIPDQYHLGNTPLNEALVYMNDLIPQFKNKYKIEKLTFITLTDGGANSFSRDIHNEKRDEFGSKYDKVPVIEIKKKRYVQDKDDFYSEGLTSMLLRSLKDQYDVNVIGFFILKRVKRWDIERYFDGATYFEREKKYLDARKQMTKDKAIIVNKKSYDKFFLLDGKSMDVQNFDIQEAKVKKGTPSELKRIFGKSMKNRLVSRVVLNKFIQEVA